MNDRHQDDPRERQRSEREQAEKELASRLERGVAPGPRDHDSRLLRDAEAWSQHVDDLVAGPRSELSGVSGDPDPDGVRKSVLERIDPRRRHGRPVTPTGRRSPAPSTPWWRRLAPVAVAAGLVGLFLWREVDSPPTEPSPRPAARVTTEAESPDTAPGFREDVSADDGSPSDRLRSLTVGPPLDVEAESLLTRIDRMDADPRARRAALERLAAIRNAVADTSLTARIDSTLAKGPR